MKSYGRFLDGYTEQEGGVGDHEIEVNLHNPEGLRFTHASTVKGKMRHEPEAKEHVLRVEAWMDSHPEHGRHGPWKATDYRWQS